MQPSTIEQRLVLADSLVALCQRAGQAIVQLYNSDQPLVVKQKTDNSPVTEADHQSQQILAEGLTALTPDWPILSEEQTIPSFAERRQWRRYWLVDPLDGTLEFINRSGEFTINIALVEDGFPVLGLIYLPLNRVAYVGVTGGHAWRQDADIEQRTPLKVRGRRPADTVGLLAGGRHKGEKLQACLDSLQQYFAGVERINSGSALKFCHLAEGLGDIYPRFFPCCEWDTAAGQALVEAAGGQLVTVDFQRFRYNCRESLINPHFYAVGAANIDWCDVLTPEKGN